MFETLVPYRGQRLGLVGAALVAVSAFVSWTGAAVVAPTGTRWVVVGTGFLAWVTILFAAWSDRAQLVVSAAGALVLGVLIDHLTAGPPGVGVYLAGGGGLLLVLGGALDYLEG
ncbi:MAG: hypothetical protein ABEJ57_02505 [Halobacteriaceae archaeon]